ncbi:hypothetical protein SAMN05421664_0985 [Chryseobacterium soldanellicola]|uniref:Uncharacterized protein n=1 Tax=Chryseobacterium soldanellicola TaxID=311333 RepID=A0A1H0YXF9_9FLAO|nr:hypothetical protein [Chryseobacterium soldanellicola]SDQ19780.1 hypothetical protein SAMN05421664_0985 [Chryseobacterium soldanellicola]
MKKLSIALFAFCLTTAFGQQKVSDYKYIIVPEKLQTFKNSFGLEGYLERALFAKNYIAVTGTRDAWPDVVRENACSALNADIINDKSLLRNKVILQFKDCNDKVLLESKGMSMIKEYEEGFPDALKDALKQVPISAPVANLPVQKSKVSENNNSTTSTAVVQESKAPAAGKYSNGKVTLQKIQIDNDQFILADANSSVPYATFKASAKKDVFRVKLQNGDSTIGYFENGNIIIEIQQSNGEFSKEVFSAK